MYPVRRMYYVRTACLHGCALSFVLRTEPSLCAARADWAVPWAVRCSCEPPVSTTASTVSDTFTGTVERYCK